jgi:hypothetical protein
MNTDYDKEVTNYDEVLHGNVAQQSKIAKLFKSNMKILKKLKKEK